MLKLPIAARNGAQATTSLPLSMGGATMTQTVPPAIAAAGSKTGGRSKTSAMEGNTGGVFAGFIGTFLSVRASLSLLLLRVRPARNGTGDGRGSAYAAARPQHGLRRSGSGLSKAKRGLRMVVLDDTTLVPEDLYIRLAKRGRRARDRFQHALVSDVEGRPRLVLAGSGAGAPRGG